MIDILQAILCIGATAGVYVFCGWLYKRYRLAVLNPVLISALIIMAAVYLTDIPYEVYTKGCGAVTDMLGPLVVILAIPLYRNRSSLKKNFFAIMAGILAGVAVSFLSVAVLCRLLGIDDSIMLSVMAKSITTPMAVEATNMLGGQESITVAAVIITGIIGAWFAPAVIRCAKIKSDTAKGIGIGASSHALGTAKAVELGEEIGAASGLAIAMTGVVTIVVILIFM